MAWLCHHLVMVPYDWSVKFVTYLFPNPLPHTHPQLLPRVSVLASWSGAALQQETVGRKALVDLCGRNYLRGWPRIAS